MPFSPAKPPQRYDKSVTHPKGQQALGVLKNLVIAAVGADDPSSAMIPDPSPLSMGAAPLISIFKNAAGVPMKALREAGTKAFQKAAKATGIPGLDDAAELFARKYPRVAAHMKPVANTTYGLPAMAQTKSPYGKVFEPIEVAFSPEQPYPLNVMAHEGTHVAQSLGNKDALTLYDLVNEHKDLGYPRNQFEKPANWAGEQMEPTPAHWGQVTKRPKNAITSLREFVENDPKRANGPARHGIRNTSQEILGILNARQEKGWKPSK